MSIQHLGPKAAEAVGVKMTPSGLYWWSPNGLQTAKAVDASTSIVPALVVLARWPIGLGTSMAPLARLLCRDDREVDFLADAVLRSMGVQT